MSLVLDLSIIEHELWGSNSNPSLNCHLHYPTDIYRTLNEVPDDKVLQYRVDYNNRPSHVISFIPTIVSTSSSYFDDFHLFSPCLGFPVSMCDRLYIFSPPDVVFWSSSVFPLYFPQSSFLGVYVESTSSFFLDLS